MIELPVVDLLAPSLTNPHPIHCAEQRGRTPVLTWAATYDRVSRVHNFDVGHQPHSGISNSPSISVPADAVASADLITCRALALV